MSSINVDGSTISCGVDQIYGFEYLRHDTAMETVERNVLSAIVEQLGYSEGDSGKLPCAMYMFSDIKGHLGDKFGQYLRKKYGRSARIKSLAGRNPNSGNNIVTYLWKPTLKWAKQFPEWKRAQDELRKRSREWSAGYGHW